MRSRTEQTRPPKPGSAHAMRNAVRSAPDRPPAPATIQNWKEQTAGMAGPLSRSRGEGRENPARTRPVTAGRQRGAAGKETRTMQPPRGTRPKPGVLYKDETQEGCCTR